MAFKVDASFLRYLTMGALATRQAMAAMLQRGLQPIELERYSCSNKIWATKVKRLRLPDLISCNTGHRVEVRAKSKLAIKMSDSPANPDRRWNSGLRPEDLIAFVHAYDEGGRQSVSNSIELFSVRDLASVARNGSVLGAPKSSSEGAERDREWPTIVPSTDGTVEHLETGKLKILRSDGRRYTYALGTKKSYVRVGDSFAAGRTFLAGTPRRKAEWPVAQVLEFDPRPLLNSTWEVDRYAAVKVLGHTGESTDRAALLKCAQSDEDSRVRLEAGRAMARLGLSDGMTALEGVVDRPSEPYLRMEVALLLAELGGTPSESGAVSLLAQIAGSNDFRGEEVRQAAIWGLGKAGLQRFPSLIPFLDAESEDERLHAVVAFAPDLDNADAELLVDVLADKDASDNKVAGAAYVLARLNASPRVVAHLYRIATSMNSRACNWARAVLGQYPRELLVQSISDSALLSALEPIALFTAARNWTMLPEITTELQFLHQQNL